MSAKPQELQTVDESAPLAPGSEALSLLAVIERAARDPMVDVNKMRELMAMRKEIVAEQAAGAWDDAMTQAQGEMRPIAADASNPQTKSKYASYLALDRAMRPIYVRNGFSLGFNTADGAGEGNVMVVCDVSRAGHTRRYKVPMPADGKGAKGGDVMTKTHAIGSAMTYGQRYLLKLIFNIAVGKDDDGNAASNADPALTAEQVGELLAIIESVGADKPLFLAYMAKKLKRPIEILGDIPASQYQAAVDALNAKAKRA